jgi:hypothetical protein
MGMQARRPWDVGARASRPTALSPTSYARLSITPCWLRRATTLSRGDSTNSNAEPEFPANPDIPRNGGGHFTS